MGLFDFVNDIGNHAERAVNRTEVSGLIIDTCWTSDEGYETAILDKNGTYPVERYSSREDAQVGHAKWVANAPTLITVKELGWQGVVDEEEITLEKA